jgi:N-acetyl-ornithine/N-acetyl-lysine deacetylase
MAMTQNVILKMDNTALAEVNRYSPLYVVKIGSASTHHEAIFDEIAALHRRGARLLVVVGGATDIAMHYTMIDRPMPTLPMRDDDVRYCPPAEMPHVIAAYERLTLPRVRARLAQRGLRVLASTACDDSLVRGAPNRPIRIVEYGRPRIVRDHRAGTVTGIEADRLNALLETFDAVCLCPPVTADDGGSPLNVDADVLAAELACALSADHLRLVTGTPGLLMDPADRTSTLPALNPGQGMEFARGRMRQKVRAAELALRASAADVAICGPHTLRPHERTRFWRAPAPAPDLQLLSRMVEISSVSGDERELADYLVQWCAEQGVAAQIDAAGNFLASRGTGERRLLMLGHLDTVPFRWPAGWEDGALTGRGSVDAKASLAVFLTTLAELDPLPGTVIRVVGTVEEERTAAGALYARDHYPADAVIIGEPSGAEALTVGYHGVCKARLTVSQTAGHTAGKGARNAASRIVDAVHDMGTAAAQLAEPVPFAVLSLRTHSLGDRQVGEAVVDLRVPPGMDSAELSILFGQSMDPVVGVELLLQTPAVLTSRADPLVRAFSRAIRQVTAKPPRLLSKKGSSDMNTLATTWRGVPMVAYGPGDASLDHTPHERLDAAEYRAAKEVLHRAVHAWKERPDD